MLQTVLKNGLTGSGPIPDGVLLPTNPMAEMAAGRYMPRCPCWQATRARRASSLHHSWLCWGKPGMKIGDAERFRMMQSFDPDAPATLTAADILDPSYLPVTAPSTGYNARTALLGKLFIAPSRDNLLQTLRSQQDNVWAYQFNWAQQPHRGTMYGAAHAFDLPFLFGNFGPSVFSRATNSRANQPGRLALSAAMMGSVRAFVHTGDPSHAGLGKPWQAWPRQWVFDAGPGELRMGQEGRCVSRWRWPPGAPPARHRPRWPPARSPATRCPRFRAAQHAVDRLARQAAQLAEFFLGEVEPARAAPEKDG